LIEKLNLTELQSVEIIMKHNLKNDENHKCFQKNEGNLWNLIEKQNIINQHLILIDLLLYFLKKIEKQ
jgi:hypothetical protein